MSSRHTLGRNSAAACKALQLPLANRICRRWRRRWSLSPGQAYRAGSDCSRSNRRHAGGRLAVFLQCTVPASSSRWPHPARFATTYSPYIGPIASLPRLVLLEALYRIHAQGMPFSWYSVAACGADAEPHRRSYGKPAGDPLAAYDLRGCVPAPRRWCAALRLVAGLPGA